MIAVVRALLRRVGMSLALLAALIIMGNAARAATVVQVPSCTGSATNFTIDLGTTQSAGVDPHWTVDTGVGPTHTSHYDWTALADRWIQPSLNATVDTHVSPYGTFTYTLTFNLPCTPPAYGTLAITGKYAVDNQLIDFHVNTTAIQPLCPSLATQCWANAQNFTVPASALHMGANTITIKVKNWDRMSGLAVNAALTGSLRPPLPCEPGSTKWVQPGTNIAYCCSPSTPANRTPMDKFCCTLQKQLAPTGPR